MTAVFFYLLALPVLFAGGALISWITERFYL